MIFNTNQIQDIIGILKRWECVFVLGQLGVDYLSQAEKDILTKSGIDLTQYTNVQGILDHAFIWGILAEAVGDTRAKKMNYSQFKKFLASGNFIPLTEDERFALDQVKNRAYTDIGGLGSRIKSGTINTIVRANLKTQAKIQGIIREKTISAVELRKSARQLASELGEITDDWERDWLRIAYYLMHSAYNNGRAQSIFKESGGDAEVYFDVYEGACDKCKELYLTDPDDVDSMPIIFVLSELIANGNNIGRKASEWLATIDPTHPYCRCTINHKRAGYEWNYDLRTFSTPLSYKPKNKKLQGVKLNIKVTTG